METLHTVLRSISRENKSRRDHLDIFREFLSHLDRIGRRARRAPAPRNKAVPSRKPKGKAKGYLSWPGLSSQVGFSRLVTNQSTELGQGRVPMPSTSLVRLLKKRFVKVFPIGIGTMNKSNFPSTRPMFDVLFALYG
jgi:hypothetical protein